MSPRRPTVLSTLTPVASTGKYRIVLAEGLAVLPGVTIELQRVQTNIIIFSVRRKDLDAPGLILKLAEQGIKAFSFSQESIRMVTHKDVDRAGILRTLEVLKRILT
jgi:threonine aldolase